MLRGPLQLTYGSDTIIVTGSTEAVLAAVTIDGGTDYNGRDKDVLVLDSPATDYVDQGFAHITGIESLTLANGGNIITLGVNFNTAGISSITGGTGNDVVNFSAIANGISINGGAGADVLKLGNFSNVVSVADDASGISVTGGNAGDILKFTTTLAATTINGGTGDDTIALAANVSSTVTINGGLGSDIIALGSGHGGAVTVKLAATALADADTVSYFLHGIDILSLGETGATVTVVTTAAGAFNNANLVFDLATNIGANGVGITGVNEHIHYAVASDTGAIYYDADGIWSVGGIQIGSIGSVANVQASDIKVNVDAGAGILPTITSAMSATALTAFFNAYIGNTAPVVATSMDASQLAVVVINAADIGAAGITGTIGAISSADYKTLNTTTTRIATAANITLTDITIADAATLVTMNTAQTGFVDASTVTTITTATIAQAKVLLVTDNGTSGDKVAHASNVAVTLSDVGIVADTDEILGATTGVVTTQAISAGTYANFSTGDKLVFKAGAFGSGVVGSSPALPVAVNAVLDWIFNTTTHTLTYETADNGTAPTTVILVLTGINNISETTGSLTLT